MTQPSANCPNCGARIDFLWPGAVQTTCAYCRAILVRHDVALERVGESAPPPPNSSPIQLRTTGRYGDASFVVVGRIIYEYDRGTWNEWHLVTTHGASLWLSDAQLEYAISRPVQPTPPLPRAGELHPGDTVRWTDQTFTVTTTTRARYRGVEGELPFAYWDKSLVTFVDLGTPTAAFGTIDYSEDPPLLFVGEYVGYAQLGLANVRTFEGW